MAQHSSPAHSGSSLTIQRVQAHPPRGILLASPALDGEERIDDRYSAYHDDLVPGLSWSAVIEAQAYALVVEDPDAPMDRPFVHWLIWNIPGTATEIPAGLGRTAHPPELPGAIQGENSAGLKGWHGTKPPPGHGVHHYHFQLFALSAPISHLGPGASLEELVRALKGLTIASGELIGTFERRDSISDAPSLGRTGGYGSDPRADTARETAAGRGGLDADDLDRHAPHTPDGSVRRL
jgi:Raf kinase inhibitor-like YbhB/YbcL family protein